MSYDSRERGSMEDVLDFCQTAHVLHVSESFLATTARIVALRLRMRIAKTAEIFSQILDNFWFSIFSVRRLSCILIRNPIVFQVMETVKCKISFQ